LEVTNTGLEGSTLNGSFRVEERIQECFVIFIHSLDSGLFRVHLKGPQTRYLIIEFLMSRKIY
jgi:hypothetical protein